MPWEHQFPYNPLVVGAIFTMKHSLLSVILKNTQFIGQNSLLSAKDCEFMIEMVCTEPTLFLDEIREKL
ncbi:hypothetical protein VP01_1011g8 [Puccinia sorghi]|uniref:Uncharacterized protein n=1 Tax=Puccinia sorghi TaxID=27349 RepID=A0A0L6VV89_9BASI|nr:hypothetical protein VP01_1011g8 [Puccinia sorghi]